MYCYVIKVDGKWRVVAKSPNLRDLRNMVEQEALEGGQIWQDRCILFLITNS